MHRAHLQGAHGRVRARDAQVHDHEWHGQHCQLPVAHTTTGEHQCAAQGAARQADRGQEGAAQEALPAREAPRRQGAPRRVERTANFKM